MAPCSRPRNVRPCTFPQTPVHGTPPGRTCPAPTGAQSGAFPLPLTSRSGQDRSLRTARSPSPVGRGLDPAATVPAATGLTFRRRRGRRPRRPAGVHDAVHIPGGINPSPTRGPGCFPSPQTPAGRIYAYPTAVGAAYMPPGHLPPPQTSRSGQDRSLRAGVNGRFVGRGALTPPRPFPTSQPQSVVAPFLHFSKFPEHFTTFHCISIHSALYW